MLLYQRRQGTSATWYTHPCSVTWDKQIPDVLHNLPLKVVGHRILYAQNLKGMGSSSHLLLWLSQAFSRNLPYGLQFMWWYGWQSGILPLLYAASCLELFHVLQNVFVRRCFALNHSELPFKHLFLPSTQPNQHADSCIITEFGSCTCLSMLGIKCSINKVFRVFL